MTPGNEELVEIPNDAAFALGKYVLALCGVSKARNEGVTELGRKVARAVLSAIQDTSGGEVERKLAMALAGLTSNPKIAGCKPLSSCPLRWLFEEADDALAAYREAHAIISQETRDAALSDGIVKG